MTMAKRQGKVGQVGIKKGCVCRWEYVRYFVTLVDHWRAEMEMP
jgi:hypothetical protein